MKIFLFLAFLLIFYGSNAQNFSGNGGAITDNQVPTAFPVLVQGLANRIDSTFGIQQVCLYIKGAAQPGLNCSDVENFVVVLPKSRLEQDAIASVLIELDMDLEVLGSKIAKARLIKQGMMQELLTGKTRLV